MWTLDIAVVSLKIKKWSNIREITLINSFKPEGGPRGRVVKSADISSPHLTI